MLINSASVFGTHSDGLAVKDKEGEPVNEEGELVDVRSSVEVGESVEENSAVGVESFGPVGALGESVGRPPEIVGFNADEGLLSPGGVGSSCDRLGFLLEEGLPGLDEVAGFCEGTSVGKLPDGRLGLPGLGES